MKKRLIGILLGTAFVLCMTACGDSKRDKDTYENAAGQMDSLDSLSEDFSGIELGNDDNCVDDDDNDDEEIKEATNATKENATDEMIIVKEEDGEGSAKIFTFLTDDGKTVVYDTFRDMQDFSHGYCVVEVRDMDDYRDGVALIDTNGNFVIEPDSFDSISMKGNYIFGQDRNHLTAYNLEMEEVFQGDYRSISTYDVKKHNLFVAKNTSDEYELLLLTDEGKVISLTTAQYERDLFVRTITDCFYLIDNDEDESSVLYAMCDGSQMPEEYSLPGNIIGEHFIAVKKSDDVYDVVQFDESGNVVGKAENIEVSGRRMYTDDQYNFVVDNYPDCAAYSKDGELLCKMERAKVIQIKDFKGNYYYANWDTKGSVDVYNSDFQVLFTVDNSYVEYEDEIVISRYLNVKTKNDSGDYVRMMYEWDGTLVGEQQYSEYYDYFGEGMYLIMTSEDNKHYQYTYYAAATDEEMFHFDSSVSGTFSDDQQYHTIYLDDDDKADVLYVFEPQQAKIISILDAKKFGKGTLFVEGMHILENSTGYYDLMGNCVFEK